MNEKVGTKPFAPFEWMLAFRYLRPRRKRAFISAIAILSFIGIALGIGVLIVVMAVMNGFRAELLTKILGINGHAILQPIDGPLTDYAEVAARIRKVPGVTGVVPLIEEQVLASAARASGALIRAVNEADLPIIPGVANNVKLGTLAGFDTAGGIAIGTRMATNLGVRVGDRVTLVAPNGLVTPFGVTPRMKAYPVVAIYEIGMSEYDSTFIFMPLKEAQLFFNEQDRASAIEIYVSNPDTIERIKPAIETAAGRQILLTDWRQRNATLFSALAIERNLQFIVLSLIVLVAALNIISGLIMLVKEKGHDIAILRTMGASRQSILRIFFITGAAIGTLGTIAGLILGTIICLNIESIHEFISWLLQTDVFSPDLYYLSQLPAKMDLGETVGVVIMGLVLSYLATFLPAWRAARLDPVEALRYE